MTVDDTYAMVTSANAVPTCYGNVAKPKGGTREANPENGVLFDVPTEVRRLANFFRALWRNCNYYVTPDPTVFEVQQLQSGAGAVLPKEPSVPALEGEALWTAPGDPRILRRFVDMVRRAREMVVLSTWVIKGMDSHELGDAIRTASERGVRFQILVRGMNWRDDHRRQCYLLARYLGRNGAILGDYWNHSKAVVADSREAMVLTANMDAQHGLDGGVEVGFHSSQPTFIAAVQAFLGRVAADAAFEFVADPTQALVAERTARQGGPRLDGHIRIRLPSGRMDRVSIERWCVAARQGLVRIRSGDARNELELEAGDVHMKVMREGDQMFRFHRTVNLGRTQQRPFSYLGRSLISLESSK